MKRYFGYIRVSTPRQGEGVSPEEQRNAIKAFAARRDFNIIAWFEEKKTAAKRGRPIFNRMLRLLAHGDADGVIIHKIDRSTRNLWDWAYLGDLLDKGIEVHFVHDGLDLRSRSGRLAADIQAAVAADYVRNLREEVLKGYYGRLKQGLFPLPAPIGYLDRGKGKPKEIDLVTGPLVRYAFERYATGTVGLKGLKAELEKRGLKPRRKNSALSLCGISTMLTNPFYTGIIYIRRTRETFAGIHEPLITRALFNKVQAVLRGRYVARQFKHEFPFRRLIRCSACGHYLRGERQKGRYVYYRCQTQTCKGVCVREEAFDHQIQMQLMLLRWSGPEETNIREMAARMLTDAGLAVENMRASLTMRLAKANERLDRLTDLLVEGTLDKELFGKRKQALLEERRSLMDEREALSHSDIPVNAALKNLELANAAYLSYKNGNPTEKRDLVESMASNFEVHGKNIVFKLKSPLEELANWRKTLNGGLSHGTSRTRAKQMLDIAIAVAEAENRPSTQQRTDNHHAA